MASVLRCIVGAVVGGAAGVIVNYGIERLLADIRVEGCSLAQFRRCHIDSRTVTLTDHVLGQGACGKVVIGMFQGKKVAVKLMPYGVGDAASDVISNVQALIREVALMIITSQSCKYTCHWYGFSIMGDKLAIIMHLYARGTLLQHIPEGGMPLDQALHMALKIAQGVAELHSKDVVLTDLKPSNILLDAEVNPVFADFGISSVMRGTKVVHNRGGTPNYMPPEQFTSTTLTCAVDIWALSCVILQMLTGVAPWSGMNQTQVSAQVVTHRRHPPMPRLPMKVGNMLKRCFRHCAKSRRTASGVVEDCQVIIRHMKQPAGPLERLAFFVNDVVVSVLEEVQH